MEKKPHPEKRVGRKDDRPSRKAAADVKKGDAHTAEKLTGEHDVYEPEGGDA